ncbi:MAG: adenylyl-sulfate kinase [archaeon]|nr:adenylyl-sulfate kinase [archaeon]
MSKIFWFYGLSGSGKTTIADKFAKDNKDNFSKIKRLDGDILRKYYDNDLGYNRIDRIRNIARASVHADHLSLNGNTVIASFTTPFKIMREHLQKMLGDRLELILVATPLEECIKRDPKGLYKKALAGEIKNMIGVDIPFEY